MRIGLVGTSATKLAGPAPAQDLYQGRAFTLARQVAQQACEHWYILSAQHGLVAPHTIITPDELTLRDLRAAGRRTWAQSVLHDLAHHNTPATTWLMLAPALYHEYLLPGLLGPVDLPLAGSGGNALLNRLGSLCAIYAAPTAELDELARWPLPPQLQTLTAAHHAVLAALQPGPQPLARLVEQITLNRNNPTQNFSRVVNLLHSLAYRGYVLLTPRGWQLTVRA